MQDVMLEEAVSTTEESSSQETETTLTNIVHSHLERYFSDLGGKTTPSGLYDSIMKAVEKPLILLVLKYTGGNQCKAARWLGVSRGTLRARMKEFDLF